MTGMETLLLLILISAIPAIAVFFWFCLCRYPFTFPMFAVSLLAGATAVFPALLFRHIVVSGGFFSEATATWGIFIEFFIHTALTEELGRVIPLIILFLLFRRFGPAGTGEVALSADEVSSGKDKKAALASAAGLISGFGFAIIESATIGAANIDSILLRAFTAAPLHGACGSRVGASIAIFTERPGRAVARFLSAVAIHGIYNIMLIIPGRLPPIAAVLIALTALASSVLSIRNGMKDQV